MTFPVNIIVSCDPNPVTDAITSYNFYLNGTKVGSSTNLVTPNFTVSVPSKGSYQFGVSAVNQWEESAQATVTANITPAGTPGNVKIVKG